MMKEFELKEENCNFHYYYDEELAQLSDFDDDDIKKIELLNVNDSCVINAISVKRVV